jgi:formylglycine-generating enzyme required for sulfatase activity
VYNVVDNHIDSKSWLIKQRGSMKRIIPLVLVFLIACAKPNDELVDEKGVSMRLVPAGEFTMGNDFGDTGEMPAHQVTLGAYYIDKYEVTNALYKSCVNTGACQPPHSFRSGTRDSYYDNPQFDHYPVVYIDWYMAKTFCEWRGARLPTEAEWEKAARGNNNGNTYPWNSSDCIFMHDETAKEGCAGGRDTAEVGFYENNKSTYGVYDMPGNAWEWVSSLYRPYPYNAYDAADPDSLERVNRSGFRNWGMPYAAAQTQLAFVALCQFRKGITPGAMHLERTVVSACIAPASARQNLLTGRGNAIYRWQPNQNSQAAAGRGNRLQQ